MFARRSAPALLHSSAGRVFIKDHILACSPCENHKIQQPRGNILIIILHGRTSNQVRCPVQYSGVLFIATVPCCSSWRVTGNTKQEQVTGDLSPTLLHVNAPRTRHSATDTNTDAFCSSSNTLVTEITESSIEITTILLQYEYGSHRRIEVSPSAPRFSNATSTILQRNEHDSFGFARLRTISRAIQCYCIGCGMCVSTRHLQAPPRES